jgi:hypothetical protein
MRQRVRVLGRTSVSLASNATLQASRESFQSRAELGLLRLSRERPSMPVDPSNLGIFNTLAAPIGATKLSMIFEIGGSKFGAYSRPGADRQIEFQLIQLSGRASPNRFTSSLARIRRVS